MCTNTADWLYAFLREYDLVLHLDVKIEMLKIHTSLKQYDEIVPTFTASTMKLSLFSDSL